MGAYGSSATESENGIYLHGRQVTKAFHDHLMHGNWTKGSTLSTILMFFRILALCHTPIPDLNEETGGFASEAVTR